MNLKEQFDQWLATVDGKPIEVEDSSNVDQCMDEAFSWLDFLKIPRETIRHLRAYEAWTLATDVTRQYFDLIVNTPDAIPHVGDLPVFSDVVGPSGHICVAKGVGDTSTFKSEDQNWDTVHFNKGKDPNTGELIPYCREVTHNYSGVYGFLRPKAVTDPLKACLAQHDTLVGLCNAKDATIKQLTDTNSTLQKANDSLSQDKTALEGQVSDLTNANTSLKQNVSAVQKQNADLHTQMADMAASDSSAIDEAVKSEKQANDKANALETDIEKIAAAMGASAPTSNAILEIYTNNTTKLAELEKQNQAQVTNAGKFFQMILNIFTGKKV